MFAQTLEASVPMRSAAAHSPAGADAVAPTRCPTACSSCGLRELCLPCGLSGVDLDRVDRLIYTQRRIKRGEALYKAGDPFKSVYAVRTGFFKSSVFLENGREQVTAFHMPGDLMGMDGIGTEHHIASAVALEDSMVCVILFSALEQASLELRSLQRQFHKVMSRELVRDQGVMMLLGAMRAEERIATFLLNLSQRFRARGYSQTEFNLRMTREEIGSYLGLKLETVSRIFSRFQDEGLVSVQKKHIQILDVDGLKSVVSA